MAHFRGTVQGSRGAVSRLGGKEKGMSANVNGWRAGVRVHAYHLYSQDKDIFTIRITGGSGSGGCYEVGTLSGDEFIPSAETCAAVDKLRGVAK